MLAGGVVGKKHAGAFGDHVYAHFIPLQVGRIPLGGDPNGLAINDKLAALYLHVTAKAAMGGVVLQHVGHVVHIEQIVDGNYFNVVTLAGEAKHEATDATEAVDTYLDSHMFT